MLCSECSIVNRGERKIRAITLYCNSWGCEICKPRRKVRLVREVVEGLPIRFLTLTTRFVEGADPVAEARRQGGAFRLLVRLYRKRFPGEEIAFFVVREATKRGWPHLHVAIRGPYLDWAWATKTWEALTGSPGVDVRFINQATNAAKYLAKYIGKEPHRFGTTKRYWHSRNWEDAIPPRKVRDRGWDSKWHIVRRGVGELAELFWLRGWEVSMRGGVSSFEARAPP